MEVPRRSTAWRSTLPHNSTRRSDSGYGNGRSATAFSSPNIVVVAPMPSASASTAPSVVVGFFQRARQA